MLHIDNYIARTEQFVNRIDYVPYISSFSGMIRILTGGLEIIAGVALAAFHLLQNLFKVDVDYLEIANRGLIYSLHGFGNIMRGAIAMVPGWNLTLLIHDRYLGRMNYPQEYVKEGVYPMLHSSPLVHY